MMKRLQVGMTSSRSNAFDATMYESRNDRWLTPLDFILQLGEFDLDPAGAPGHRTAREVWTPEETGDGLALPWHGRVWLNPPYGRTMIDWIGALAEHGRGTALIFARTETRLFHEHVWPKASAVMFIRGRIEFLRPDGTPSASNAGAPSVLVAYGEQDADALESSGLRGHTIHLSSSERHRQ